MGWLLVVTGPPGAGKSTVSAELVTRFPRSALIQGDAFFGFLAEGAVEPWLPAAQEQNDAVVRAAAGAAGRFAGGGYATVYDGVIGPWFLPTFVEAAGVTELHYVMLLPNVDRCVRRVDTRTGHGFTDEPATRKMHAEFARAEIDARHVLVEPADDLEQVVAEILRRFDGGSLAYRR
jgi:hypothetical protein